MEALWNWAISVCLYRKTILPVHLLNKNIVIVSVEKLFFFDYCNYWQKYFNDVHQHFVQTTNLCFLFLTPIKVSVTYIAAFKPPASLCVEMRWASLSIYLQWTDQNIFTRFQLLSQFWALYSHTQALLQSSVPGFIQWNVVHLVWAKI